MGGGAGPLLSQEEQPEWVEPRRCSLQTGGAQPGSLPTPHTCHSGASHSRFLLGRLGGQQGRLPPRIVQSGKQVRQTAPCMASCPCPHGQSLPKHLCLSQSPFRCPPHVV